MIIIDRADLHGEPLSEVLSEVFDTITQMYVCFTCQEASNMSKLYYNYKIIILGAHALHVVSPLAMPLLKLLYFLDTLGHQHVVSDGELLHLQPRRVSQKACFI